MSIEESTQKSLAEKEGSKEEIGTPMVIENHHVKLDKESGECHCDLCNGNSFHIIKENDAFTMRCKDCGN